MISQIYYLARLSISDTKKAMENLFSLGWTIATACMVLIAATCTSTILGHVKLIFTQRLGLPIPEEIIKLAMASPIMSAITWCLLFFLFAFFMYRGGQWFGGTADFRQILILIAWFQVLRVICDIIVIFTFSIFAPLGILTDFILLLVSIYVLVLFVKNGHGLSSFVGSSVLMISSYAFAHFSLMVVGSFMPKVL